MYFFKWSVAGRNIKFTRDRRGRYRMVVGFTTTSYLCNQFLTPLTKRGVLDKTLCDQAI
jgi:hypothetical protein